jgi:DNA mismatch repair protein mutL
MGRIVQLDERLSNMIAAGEVVERPSSVVKELVENAIDAGAKNISISLIDSGIKEIVIEDDGCGMSQDDAKLCFSRHATSKIKNEYDLFRIQTLGFRGEAIPSIASVSTFTLLTSDGMESTKVIYKGGHLEDISLASRSKGTTIKVEGLFYNVPARLKYLKSLPSELGSITYLVSKYILANPNISFTLKNNDRLIYKTLGNGDLVRIFGELYGLEVAKGLLRKSYEGNGYKINLSICKSVVSRANKLEITTIVNDRYVKSNPIIEAIIKGYHTYIPEGRYPIALCDITIDPILIDVNVHPTKMQIKISNEEEMASVVENLTKELLKSASMIPDIKPFEEIPKSYTKQNIFNDIILKEESLKPGINNIKEEATSFEAHSDEKAEESDYIKEASSKLDSLLNSANSYSDTFKENAQAQEEDIEQKVEKKDDNIIPYLEYCGAVHGTYLIFQNEEGMYLMDQHAAAERINYEYYLEVLRNPVKASSMMLIPLHLEFTASEMISIKENLAIFESLGFKLEQASPTSFFVREYPMWLHVEDCEDFLRNILYNAYRDKQFTIEKYRDRLAAEIACKASIKANHAIKKEEIDILLTNLRKCKNPYTCPHGRPTIIKITTLELEKMFKRVM